jgi:hypothetical protein
MKKKSPQNSQQDQHIIQDDSFLQILNAQYEKDRKLIEGTRLGERKNNERLVLVSSLLLLSMTTVIQLASTSMLDTALSISTMCFSVAIPLLAFSALAENWQRIYNQERHYHQNEKSYRLFLINAIIAVSLDLIGFLMVFIHFSPISGLLFGITAILAMSMHSKWEKTRDNPE